MSQTKAIRPREIVETPLEDRELRIVLEIERGGLCVMDDIEGDIMDVDVRLEGDDCRVDLSVNCPEQDGLSKKQFTSDICDHCPGVPFAKYGCIPRYQTVERGSFVMETYIEDTATLSAMVEDIRERCERVVVHSLMSVTDERHTDHCSVDLSVLTPKQCEAMFKAKRAGYYDPDSTVQLEEIAAQMDISSSALSQRLNRAEANIVRQISSGCDCGGE